MAHAPVEILHEEGDQVQVARRQQQGPRPRRSLQGRRLPQRVHPLHRLDPFRRHRRGLQGLGQDISLLHGGAHDRPPYAHSDPAAVPAVLPGRGQAQDQVGASRDAIVIYTVSRNQLNRAANRRSKKRGDAKVTCGRGDDVSRSDRHLFLFSSHCLM